MPDKEISARAILNLGVDYVYKKVSLSATIYNLLNTDYYQGGSGYSIPIPQQSLNFLLRLSYHF